MRGRIARAIGFAMALGLASDAAFAARLARIARDTTLEDVSRE